MGGVNAGVGWGDTVAEELCRGGGYRLAYIHLIEHYKIIEHVIHNIPLPG